MKKSDINQIARQALDFRDGFVQTKRRLAAEFDAYPYDSLANFIHIDRLLSRPHRDFLQLTGAGPVVDIGCADGDVAFFLETLGCSVHAVDWPLTNSNLMRGVKAIREATSSTVEVYERDLDTQFVLPGPHYTVAFFLGALYHLKNPYFVLERIAHQAHYCFLSTRVARFTPDHKTRIETYPLAYLVGPDDLNADNTNYWIFSEAGLRQLVARSGWRLLDFYLLSPELDSDPVRPDRDQRAFCLLESEYFQSHPLILLRSGWHELEDHVWRWTERCFSIHISGLTPGAWRLRLPLYISEAMPPTAFPLEISVHSGDRRLGAVSSPAPGEALLDLVLDSLPSEADLEFRSNAAIPPAEDDLRERALIVKASDLLTLITRLG